MNSKQYFKVLETLFARNHDDFLKLIPKCEQFSSEDVKMIYKALYKATKLHDGQVRKSGEAYITHPIAVASILAYYGLDWQTTTAGLLHDTIEDTSYTLDECKKDFGDEVTSLVDGVTKIGSGVNNQTHNKILNVAKKDPRIIAIKAGADRLHNMYTLDALSLEKQKKMASETMDFYVEIAKILGIYKLKDALQDLSLYYLDNDAFVSLYNTRENLKQIYNDKINELGSKTQEILSKKGIAMGYNYRIKNVGGIHEEFKTKSLGEIPDLLAIKMVVSDYLQCYETLGVVHNVSNPVVGNLNDFISNPKSNGYKSLNTNVKYKDANVQVRIRTKGMQKTNDLGVFSDLNDNMKNKLNNEMKKKLTNLSKI